MLGCEHLHARSREVEFGGNWRILCLHIPPNDLAGFLAGHIGGHEEEPWLDILLAVQTPKAYSEQRKAAASLLRSLYTRS